MLNSIHDCLAPVNSFSGYICKVCFHFIFGNRNFHSSLCLLAFFNYIFNIISNFISRELHITRSAMSQKMTGKSVFTLRQIRQIADYFGVSVDSLLGREPLEVA